MHHAATDRQISAGRNHVKLVWFDRHAVGRLTHLHRGMAGQELDQHALMGGVEMLDQNQRHAVTGGQCVEQFAARIQAAGRRPDADHGEAGVVSPAFRCAGRRDHDEAIRV